MASLLIPVGCSIAGYTSLEIGPMFRETAALDNVFLPVSFWKVLLEIDIEDQTISPCSRE